MRFCEGIAKAKLGCRVVPGSTVSIGTGTVLPAISNAHSVLMELFYNFNGIYVALGGNPYLSLFNAAYNEVMYDYLNLVTKLIVLRLGSVIGGADLASGIPIPKYPKKHHYTGLLLDRTNNRKKIYDCGSLALNDAIAAVNPNFNTINNIFYFAAPGGVTTVDFGSIVIRLTTLSSVPADIDAAIARMYRRPMVLDASLQAAAVLASQWDFEDFNTIAPATNVPDHGIVGGYPLTSSVSLADKICIVEKP